MTSSAQPLDKKALFARLLAVQYPMDQETEQEEEEQPTSKPLFARPKGA
jgi:hypothetical protein